jgi:hypothetical protein
MYGETARSPTLLPLLSYHRDGSDMHPLPVWSEDVFGTPDIPSIVLHEPKVLACKI